jgi:uncharacterized cupredoxin-like copper-binding protein
MGSSRSIRTLPALILAAALLAVPAIALANVNGQTANSQASAFPMTAGVTYSGDFQSQTETEYLSFQVPRAGTSLHFVLRNTTGSCVNPSSETPCPVFGTLIDAHGQQVGGEGSSAGTSRIDAGKSGVIDWTFTQAGTYWVAVDSSGDFPTFSISYRDVTKVLTSLIARSTQRGTAVRAVAKVGRPCKRIVARLVRGSATLGKSVLRNVRTGRVPIKVPLNRAGRSLLARNHKLRLKLVVVATPTTGSSQTRSRTVTLKG